MKAKLLKQPKEDTSLHNLHALVEVGKTYEVFGLFMPDEVSLERVYICIADDVYESMDINKGDEPYPVWLPLSNFELVDPQVRDDWQLVWWDEEIPGYLLTFPEWSDDSFYYWLVDGRKKELEIFAKVYDRYTS